MGRDRPDGKFSSEGQLRGQRHVRRTHVRSTAFRSGDHYAIQRPGRRRRDAKGQLIRRARPPCRRSPTDEQHGPVRRADGLVPGPNYPRTPPPTLAPGSVSGASGRAGPRFALPAQIWDSQMGRRRPAATTRRPANANGPDGYSWWDNPPSTSRTHAVEHQRRPRPPADPTSARIGTAAVVNPGGIQANPVADDLRLRGSRRCHGSVISPRAGGRQRPGR